MKHTSLASLAFFTLCATTLGPAPSAQDSAPSPGLPPANSRIDVVFVLDTTGSMSGLIEGAKEKVWSIANAIALADPTPEIRMGLVAYRDRGDAYVTQLTPLTDDLDKVHANLVALTAGGGGDAPESVNQALHEAVTKMAWSEDSQALKLVYLVGDAPPHMDYGDVLYAESCELAARAEIVINTLQCGDQAETKPVWEEIARLSEGRYFPIPQSGGVVRIETPFDGHLVALGERLEETVLPYGTEEERGVATKRREASAKTAKRSSRSSLAERAIFNSSAPGTRNLAGAKDLVQDLLEKKVALGDVPDEELPEALRALEVEERASFVETWARRRNRLQAEIRGIREQRAAFLAEAGEGGADAFDLRVLTALREQAAKKNIRYAAEGEEAPGS